MVSPTQKIRELLDQVAPHFEQEPLDSVSYDFRILTARNVGALWTPDEVIYERRELAEPRATVDAPLAACERYYFTVRARFRSGSQQRVTEWTGPFLMESDTTATRHPTVIHSAGARLASSGAGIDASMLVGATRWGYSFVAPPPKGDTCKSASAFGCFFKSLVGPRSCPLDLAPNPQ